MGTLKKYLLLGNYLKNKTNLKNKILSETFFPKKLRFNEGIQQFGVFFRILREKLYI